MNLYSSLLSLVDFGKLGYVTCRVLGRFVVRCNAGSYTAQVLSVTPIQNS